MTAPPVRNPERAAMLAGIQRVEAMLHRLKESIYEAEAQEAAAMEKPDKD